MTFEEAQQRFSSIADAISPGMSGGDLLAKQRELHDLLDSLPDSAQFDSIAEAITELQPKLSGQITDVVVRDLKAQDATLRETTALLNSVASNAQADARTLSLTQPKLLVAALTESVSTLKQIREAARNKNFEEAAAKSSSLVTLLEDVRQSVKVT